MTVARSSSLKRAVLEGGTISATERRLRDQAFATPEKVAEMLEKVRRQKQIPHQSTIAVCVTGELDFVTIYEFEWR